MAAGTKKVWSTGIYVYSTGVMWDDNRIVDVAGFTHVAHVRLQLVHALVLWGIQHH